MQRVLMEVPRFSYFDHVIFSHVPLCLVAVKLKFHWSNWNIQIVYGDYQKSWRIVQQAAETYSETSL